MTKNRAVSQWKANHVCLLCESKPLQALTSPSLPGRAISRSDTWVWVLSPGSCVPCSAGAGYPWLHRRVLSPRAAPALQLLHPQLSALSALHFDCVLFFVVAEITTKIVLCCPVSNHVDSGLDTPCLKNLVASYLWRVQQKTCWGGLF